MTSLLQIITDAAAKERARYEVVLTKEGPLTPFALIRWDGPAEVVMRGFQAAVEAHLERLVSIAILKAIREAGLAVVPVEPTAEMLGKRLAMQFDIRANMDGRVGYAKDRRNEHGEITGSQLELSRPQKRDIYRAILAAAPAVLEQPD